METRAFSVFNLLTHTYIDLVSEVNLNKCLLKKYIYCLFSSISWMTEYLCLLLVGFLSSMYSFLYYILIYLFQGFEEIKSQLMSTLEVKKL